MKTTFPHIGAHPEYQRNQSNYLVIKYNKNIQNYEIKASRDEIHNENEIE